MSSKKQSSVTKTKPNMLMLYWRKSNIYMRSLIVFALLSTLALIIFGIVKAVDTNKHTHSSSGGSGSGFPGIPKGVIKAAWSSIIGCGEGEFDIISLASALPANYSVSYNDFFTKTINGTYKKDMSKRSKTRYVISIGGSNATPDGWKSFIEKLLSQGGIMDFMNACKCYGIVGVDWDLEGTDASMVPDIIKINRALKSADKNFIVILTILLGSTTTFAPMIPEHDTYDYLALMLYNGGMYTADGTGAGCDWDGWAELICSRGTAGCGMPLREPKEKYAADANLSSVQPNKVLLGLIIDTTGPRLNKVVQDRADALIKQYGAAGVFIWVLPGWQRPSENIPELRALGYTKIGDCSTSNTCPLPEKPCVHGSECVATSCAKRTQDVTDEQCKPCPDQTYWPCNMPGFCSQLMPVDTSCTKFK